MQVSSDGVVRFIGRSRGVTREGRDVFTVNIADESGNTIKFFCEKELFYKLDNAKFGDEMSLVLSVNQYNSGISTRPVDVVI